MKSEPFAQDCLIARPSKFILEQGSDWIAEAVKQMRAEIAREVDEAVATAPTGRPAPPGDEEDWRPIYDCMRF